MVVKSTIVLDLVVYVHHGYVGGFLLERHVLSGEGSGNVVTATGMLRSCS